MKKIKKKVIRNNDKQPATQSTPAKQSMPREPISTTKMIGFKSARCEACIIGVSGINSNCELFVRYYEEVEVLRQIVRSATGRIKL